MNTRVSSTQARLIGADKVHHPPQLSSPAKDYELQLRSFKVSSLSFGRSFN